MSEIDTRVRQIDSEIKRLFAMNLMTREWKFSPDADVKAAQEVAKDAVLQDFNALRPAFSEQSRVLEEFLNNMSKHFQKSCEIIDGREAALTQELIDRVFGPQGPPKHPAKKQKTGDN